ncbi:MAG: glycosyltransferase, partial [Gemmatimonadetes bacterium]|nr:glycosyltransferase [Gemmatimonadota bacterium]
TADDLTGKQRCKAALQRAYGLPQRARTPLLGMSARLVSQKGLDLILGAHFLWAADAQFVFLGQGEKRYETALREIAAGVPDRVAVETNFTDEREHRLLAGADVLLMPSLYEPCGLTQMRAQRYGALPVGRRTGGLADTIEDEETGFLFDDYTPAALEQAVRRALGLYEEREAWERHMRQAMARDFSWS